MKRVLSLPASFYEQRYAGEVASRIALVDLVTAAAATAIVPPILGAVTSLAILAVLCVYSFQIAMVALAAGIVVVISTLAAGKKRKQQALRMGREQQALNGTFAQGIRNIEFIKAAGREDEFISEVVGHHTRLSTARVKLEGTATVLNSLPTLVGGVAVAATMTIGGLLVVAGQMQPGAFIAVVTLVPIFLAPLGSWTRSAVMVQEARGWLSRLDDVLEQDTDPLATAIPDFDELLATQPIPTPDRHIDLRADAVTFGRSPIQEPNIVGVSLEIGAGRSLGVVGKSGCGKSTIARLVVGLLTPQVGAVTLGGQELDRLPVGSIPKAVGYVDQDVVLFAGTVRENISLFDDSIPLSEVIRAAKIAGIHECITQRIGAYEAVVLDGGRNFSGGERQRIEIARAIVRNPAIVILDEATSALDPIVERHVMEQIRASGASTLVVAHRLSTVRDCDEIVVVEQGRIVERGTHSELVAAEGLYFALVRDQ